MYVYVVVYKRMFDDEMMEREEKIEFKKLNDDEVHKYIYIHIKEFIYTYIYIEIKFYIRLRLFSPVPMTPLFLNV